MDSQDRFGKIAPRLQGYALQKGNWYIFYFTGNLSFAGRISDVDSKEGKISLSPFQNTDYTGGSPTWVLSNRIFKFGLDGIIAQEETTEENLIGFCAYKNIEHSKKSNPPSSDTAKTS